MASKFSMAGGSGLFGAEDHLEAQDRMGEAMEQLKIREEHEKAQRQAAQVVEQQQILAHLDAQETQFINETVKPEHYEGGQSNVGKPDDDDDDFEDDFEEDPDFLRLRELRMKQLQEQYRIKQENLAKGHGEYREIVQDEFLKEVTSSPRVVVHFYHRDFERCKIIDMVSAALLQHMAKIAKRHIECKFLKLNAEKAPFFVSKLVIRVLPTIIYFKDGIASDDRIVGFEGLADDMRPGKEDEFPTVNLARRLAKVGAIEGSDDEIEKADVGAKKASIQVAYHSGYDSDE
ncbi:thioredoxin-like protein [Achlya hypogyna]|uniref:Thioredoxin-like protein n=1 Tax=Achlya hypogyna TaxID=1202772 RepID=A0A1V9YNA1_ACHHY|nr:thioredoxin-like protein [Achlya hypogyna]